MTNKILCILCTVLLVSSALFSQENKKYLSLDEIYNDPLNHPKNVASLSFLSVGNFFGFTLHDTYTIDENLSAYGKLIMPYGKFGQAEDASTNFQDYIKLGYNFRVGFDYILAKGMKPKSKTIFLYSGYDSTSVLNSQIIYYTKGIKTKVGRHLAVGGGLESSRLDKTFVIPNDTILESSGVTIINPTQTVLYGGLNYQNVQSIGLISESHKFERIKYRRIRLYAEILYAASLSADAYIYQLNSDNETYSIVSLDMNSEKVPDLSRKNVGFRMGFDVQRLYFGWSRTTVTYGFEYAAIPYINGGPREWVNIHAGIGFISKKFTRKTML